MATHHQGNLGPQTRNANMDVLFYFGGFAPVGGIESFAKNLLLHLQRRRLRCAMLCWGPRSGLLASIVQAGISVIRSPWRWGCRWRLPDWLLLPAGMLFARRAGVVIFGKMPSVVLMRVLRRATPGHIRFVLITPYRPIGGTGPVAQRQSLESYSLYDPILVQAELFRTDLRQMGYTGRVDVIPYLTDEGPAPAPLPGLQPFRVGFLGRFVPDKNLSLLFRAFALFRERYLARYAQSESPKLALFGDGPERAQLEALASELGITSWIEFHGAIPHERVPESIASCHLFAFSSTHEGQCLAALEILACGRPVVATDAGAFPEILTDRRLGTWVAAPDAARFADAMLTESARVVAGDASPEAIQQAYSERYGARVVGDEYLAVLSRCGVSAPA